MLFKKKKVQWGESRHGLRRSFWGEQRTLGSREVSGKKTSEKANERQTKESLCDAELTNVAHVHSVMERKSRAVT